MKKSSWFFWALVGLAWLAFSLPLSDYSLTSLLDLSEGPPRTRDELWKLLQNIVYAANFSILAMTILYGLNRGWYLDEGYPAWLQRFNLHAKFKGLFGNKAVFLGANIVLGLLGLLSTAFLFLHGRILGRALGYW